MIPCNVKRILGLVVLLGITVGFGVDRVEAQTNHARLWQAYAARFISSDGRVIDPLVGDRTTSEGQSYALFFALVNNDREHFDKILGWTKANLGQGDLTVHLPAWSWGLGKDGAWGVQDANSASDSDLWIAYDLIEAGHLWKEPSYAVMGRRLANQIARREVVSLPGFGPVLLPGPVGFKFQKMWVLNPSYTPVFLLNQLASVDPAGPWADVAAMYPTLIQRSARQGFAMDWVCYAQGGGVSPCLANGKQTPTPVGSYDAIRVYLWAGMSGSSSQALVARLAPFAALVHSLGAPPENVDPRTALARDSRYSPLGFSGAVLPFLRALAQEGDLARQMEILHEASLRARAGAPTNYYDQSLILFGKGWIDRQFAFDDAGRLRPAWLRE